MGDLETRPILKSSPSYFLATNLLFQCTFPIYVPLNLPKSHHLSSSYQLPLCSFRLESCPWLPCPVLGEVIRCPCCRCSRNHLASLSDSRVISSISSPGQELFFVTLDTRNLITLGNSGTPSLKIIVNSLYLASSPFTKFRFGHSSGAGFLSTFAGHPKDIQALHHYEMN